jgi:hypothetical protein
VASATFLLGLLLMEGHEAKAAPIVTTSTTPVDFGDVVVGQSGIAVNDRWTITGQNSGDPLSISSAATPFTGAGSSTRLSSSSKTVSYDFSPSAMGTVSDTLVGRDVATTGSSASLTLTGSATVVPTTTKGTGTRSAGTVGTVDLATVSYKTATALILDLRSVPTDQNGGNAGLANPPIDKYSISGANVADFSVAIADNSGITHGAMLEVPMPVPSTIAYPSRISSLTTFTDEGTGLGGYGDNFTYALTVLSVPEPASLALLGAGLAGLVGFRRLKRGAPRG